jgi:hypothetical protein
MDQDHPRGGRVDRTVLLLHPVAGEFGDGAGELILALLF